MYAMNRSTPIKHNKHEGCQLTHAHTLSEGKPSTLTKVSSYSRHSSGRLTVLLFSCGCEADASFPDELALITLTCDTTSSGGTENCGTFTETPPPWAALSFIQSWWGGNLRLEQNKVKSCFNTMQFKQWK